MPGFVVWRGDAQGRAQVTFATPSNVEIGDLFTLTINRKDITVTATAATVANVVSLLVAAVGQFTNTIPEWSQISASTGFAADGVTVTHVVLTGPADGTPFTVTASTADAGAGQVTITVLVEGVAAKNEIQRVRLGGAPTGGTFTLTFAGQTTAGIAYNATAAAVVTALEALSNIGVGDVAVTESATSDWLVTFQGAYAETDVPLMTGNGASITGACSVSVATTQAGGNVNEVQTMAGTIGYGSSNSYTLIFVGSETVLTNIGSSTAAGLKAELEALPSIGAGNVLVTASDSGTTRTFRIEFVGALGGGNVPALTFGTTPDGGVITTVTDGSKQNEKQQVALVGGPLGGTFTLTFEGATTAGIAYDANNAAVVTALEGLANIGVGDVAVTGGPLPNTAIVVEFQGALAQTDRQQMTGSGTSLTGASVNVSVTQEAIAGVNEKQQIELGSGTIGGTFTLTYSGQTTAAIAWNASAATVDTELEALSNIGVGDVTCSGGALPGTAITVEFTGALAKTNVVTMTGNGDSLTTAGSQNLVISQSVTPTGPNWVNEPENWDTGANPTTGDTAVFDDPNAGDVLWGLDQLSNVLAKLIVRQSFEGKKIGLPDWNPLGFYEYRPKEYTQPASIVEIGLGPGSGPVLVRLNNGATQCAVTVYNSGQPEESKSRAVLWRGSHISNTVEVLGGSFGSAVDPEETAAIDTLRIGGGTGHGTPPDVFIGSGVTLENVDMDAGSATIHCAVTVSMRQEGGESRIEGSGAVAQLTLRGDAVCHYNTSGALGGATEVSGDAILDFGEDLTPKTVTNPIDVYGDFERDAVRDPYKVVSALILDFNGMEVKSLGKHIRLTRGAVA